MENIPIESVPFEEDQIAKFDKLGKHAKIMVLCMADNMETIKKQNREILDCFHDKGKGLYVIGVIEGVAVLEYTYNAPFENAVYTSAFKNEKGEWQKTHNCCATGEEALLYALGEKHLGSNSQFPFFATRMLDLDKVYDKK